MNFSLHCWRKPIGRWINISGRLNQPYHKSGRFFFVGFGRSWSGSVQEEHKTCLMCLHLLFRAGLNWFNCHLKTNWHLKNRLQRLFFRSAEQNARRKIVHTDIELSNKTPKKWDGRNHWNGIRVVKQIMLISYFIGHPYFLKECPDTLLKFSAFKLHYRQERQEYHGIPAVLKQHVLMTLWDTNLSRIIAWISDMFLAFLCVWQRYKIIPGPPSMLRVTSIRTKGSLRENTILSLVKIKILMNFSPSTPNWD